MKRYIILISFLTFVTQIVEAQSPWTRDKGKAYTQLGFTGLFYDSYMRDGKVIKSSNNYSDMTFQAYGEYGILKNLEATFILPFKIVGYESTISKNAQSITGLGNITAGLKYKLFDKTWKVSAGLVYSANTILKDSTKNLTTGFNSNTFTPYISVGSSKGKWYYFANFGYGYMDNNYSDFAKATFEVGYNIFKNGHLIFVLDTRNIVSKESASDNDIYQWPSYFDRTTYNAIGLKGNYEFKKDKIGTNLAVFGATGINNSPLAPTINLAIYTKL